MAELFISYRRSDQDITGRMYDRLAEQFGKDRIFKDVDNIPVGVDFRKALAEAVQRCDVLLVMIGDNWVGLADGTGQRRLDDANDFVRIEIEAALQRDIPVIPVLVHNAQPPTALELPASIADLSYRQVAKLRPDPDFAGDIERLCAAIDTYVRGKTARRRDSDPSRTRGACPYRGLESFRVDDADLYFGREDLVELATGRIRNFIQSEDKLKFLAVIGASGSGKSSLAYAGVLASIHRAKIEGSSNWPVVVCRPGHNPLEGLAMALVANPTIKSSAGDIAELIDRLKVDQRRLHLTTRLALEGKPNDQRVVVLVDQFEEVFRPGDDELKRALIDNLLYAASVPDGRTIVLLTMRADFYAKASAYPNLAGALSTNQILVGPMSENQRRRAIEEPAKLAGATFESGLVEMLIQDMKTEAGALPFLQDALTQLWDRQKNGVLSVEDYKAIGRLAGAVEHRANVLYQTFDDSEKETCRKLFLRLTQPGEGTEDTKRRVPRSVLGDADEINCMVQKLAAARLITTEGRAADGHESEAGFVEVSHEALIRGWSQLRRWIDEDRDALRIQHQLTTDAAAWKRNPDDAFLYRGTRLEIAEEWVSAHLDVLTSVEQGFLDASRALRDHEKREKALAASRLRRRAWFAGIAAVVATALAGLALLLAFTVSGARARETTQRRIAVFLQSLFQDADPFGPYGFSHELRTNPVSARSTVRELLESGNARLKTELQERPVERADFLESIGIVYRGLGLYEQANAILRDSLELRLEHDANNRASIALNQHNLAWSLHYSGDYIAAAPLYEEALETLEEIHGPYNAEVASTKQQYALLLSDAQVGEFDRASRLLKEVIVARTRLFGAESQGVAIAYSAQALALFAKGDVDAGRLAGLNAWSIFSEETGSHFGIAMSGHLRGLEALEKGDSEEALKHLDQAVKNFTEVMSADHPFVALALVQHAGALLASKKYQLAERTLERVKAITAHLRADHPKKTDIRWHFALLYLETNRGDKAKAELEENQRHMLANYGANSWQYAKASEELGSLLYELNHQDEAITQLRQAVSISKRIDTERPDRMAFFAQSLGAMLAETGQFKEAIPMLKDAVVFRRQSKSDLKLVADTLLLLGQAQLEHGQVKPAQASLVQARSELVAFGRNNWAARAQALLGDALLRDGQTDQAEKDLTRAVEIISEIRSASHDWNIHVRRALAELYTKTGQTEKAALYDSQSEGDSKQPRLKYRVRMRRIPYSAQPERESERV